MFVDDELGLYAVSDGMGGHAAGEVASRAAIAAVVASVREQRELLGRIREGLANESELCAVARTAVADACRAVYEQAARDPRHKGMGCTLTVLLMGNRKAAMAHVGDSRLYLYRRERVRQLSADHSLAQELVRLGLISSREADFVPEGHSLTRAVGVRESVAIDEMLFAVHPDDVFLLCSDGLWDYVRDAQELEGFLGAEDIDASAKALVAFANAAGGHDNITALVVRIDRDQSDEDADCVPRASMGISATLKIDRPSTADASA